MVETLGKSYWCVYHDPAGRDTKFEESARRNGQELGYWTDAQRAVYSVLDRLNYLLGKWRDVAIYERMAA